MFKCEFSTGNAAFEAEAYFGEIARTLRALADYAEQRAGVIDGGTISDINGNKIGAWSLTED